MSHLLRRNLALASLVAALAVPAVAQTAPAAPTGLVGWTSAYRVVTLEWDDPDDSTITKYQWRNAQENSAFGSWADISGSGASTTTYTTATFPNGFGRRLRVRACVGTTCRNASEARVDGFGAVVIGSSITSTPRAGWTSRLEERTVNWPGTSADTRSATAPTTGWTARWPRRRRPPA